MHINHKHYFIIYFFPLAWWQSPSLLLYLVQFQSLLDIQPYLPFLIKYNNNSRSFFSISIIKETVPVHSEKKRSSVAEAKGSLISICTCSLRGKRLGFLRPIYLFMSRHLDFISHSIFFFLNILSSNQFNQFNCRIPL